MFVRIAQEELVSTSQKYVFVMFAFTLLKCVNDFLENDALSKTNATTRYQNMKHRFPHVIHVFLRYSRLEKRYRLEKEGFMSEIKQIRTQVIVSLPFSFCLVLNFANFRFVSWKLFLCF